MFLETFVLLSALSFILFIIGRYTESPYIALGGALLLILTGIYVYSGGLQEVTSDTVGLISTIETNYTYGNFTDAGGGNHTLVQNTTDTYAYDNYTTNIKVGTDIHHTEALSLVWALVGIGVFIIAGLNRTKDND